MTLTISEAPFHDRFGFIDPDGRPVTVDSGGRAAARGILAGASLFGFRTAGMPFTYVYIPGVTSAESVADLYPVLIMESGEEFVSTHPAHVARDRGLRDRVLRTAGAALIAARFPQRTCVTTSVPSADAFDLGKHGFHRVGSLITEGRTFKKPGSKRQRRITRELATAHLKPRSVLVYYRIIISSDGYRVLPIRVGSPLDRSEGVLPRPLEFHNQNSYFSSEDAVAAIEELLAVEAIWALNPAAN